jgi:hypothetical protein
MKAREALIAWTPVSTAFREQTAGQVKVGPLLTEGDPDWTRPFAYTGGAAYIHTRLKGASIKAQLFIEFNTLVMRDGIDPAVAHNAFLAIDEYAESISPDIRGARDPDDRNAK